MNNSVLKKWIGMSLIAMNVAISGFTLACTRVVYTDAKDAVLTGRTLDWMEDMESNIWLFPRGILRHGTNDSDSITWQSKYGSIAVSSYEASTVDGMNEMGLAGNILYLARANYGESHGGRKLLCTSLWLQYALDNFDSVKGAVEALQREPFRIVGPLLPNGYPATLQLTLSDTSGDSAIFEYLDGKLVIHHDREHRVVTNAPQFSEQSIHNAYWKKIGGLNFLPGTYRAEDRLARASFLLDELPKRSFEPYLSASTEGSHCHPAIPGLLGLLRSLSIPLGVAEPLNGGSTLWRTIADHKRKTYWFDSVKQMNSFWVSLEELDFSSDTSVKKLNLSEEALLTGNVAAAFKVAEPLPFLLS